MTVPTANRARGVMLMIRDFVHSFRRIGTADVQWCHAMQFKVIRPVQGISVRLLFCS